MTKKERIVAYQAFIDGLAGWREPADDRIIDAENDRIFEELRFKSLFTPSKRRR